MLRVMLTCDSFALVGWTSTPKGGLPREFTMNISEGQNHFRKAFRTVKHAYSNVPVHELVR